MDEFDRDTRRQARKLVLWSALLGFVLGILVGFGIAHYTIDRVVIVPIGEGVQI